MASMERLREELSRALYTPLYLSSHPAGTTTLAAAPLSPRRLPPQPEAECWNSVGAPRAGDGSALSWDWCHYPGDEKGTPPAHSLNKRVEYTHGVCPREVQGTAFPGTRVQGTAVSESVLWGETHVAVEVPGIPNVRSTRGNAGNTCNISRDLFSGSPKEAARTSPGNTLENDSACCMKTGRQLCSVCRRHAALEADRQIKKTDRQTVATDHRDTTAIGREITTHHREITTNDRGITTDSRVHLLQRNREQCEKFIVKNREEDIRGVVFEDREVWTEESERRRQTAVGFSAQSESLTGESPSTSVRHRHCVCGSECHDKACARSEDSEPVSGREGPLFSLGDCPCAEPNTIYDTPCHENYHPSAPENSEGCSNSYCCDDDRSYVPVRRWTWTEGVRREVSDLEAAVWVLRAPYVDADSLRAFLQGQLPLDDVITPGCKRRSRVVSESSLPAGAPECRSVGVPEAPQSPTERESMQARSDSSPTSDGRLLGGQNCIEKHTSGDFSHGLRPPSPHLYSETTFSCICPGNTQAEKRPTEQARTAETFCRRRHCAESWRHEVKVGNSQIPGLTLVPAGNTNSRTEQTSESVTPETYLQFSVRHEAVFNLVSVLEKNNEATQPRESSKQSNSQESEVEGCIQIPAPLSETCTGGPVSNVGCFYSQTHGIHVPSSEPPGDDSSRTTQTDAREQQQSHVYDICRQRARPDTGDDLSSSKDAIQMPTAGKTTVADFPCSSENGDIYRSDHRAPSRISTHNTATQNGGEGSRMESGVASPWRADEARDSAHCRWPWYSAALTGSSDGVLDRTFSDGAPCLSSSPEAQDASFYVTENPVAPRAWELYPDPVWSPPPELLLPHGAGVVAVVTGNLRPHVPCTLSLDLPTYSAFLRETHVNARSIPMSSPLRR